MHDGGGAVGVVHDREKFDSYNTFTSRVSSRAKDWFKLVGNLVSHLAGLTIRQAELSNLAMQL